LNNFEIFWLTVTAETLSKSLVRNWTLQQQKQLVSRRELKQKSCSDLNFLVLSSKFQCSIMTKEGISSPILHSVLWLWQPLSVLEKNETSFHWFKTVGPVTTLTSEPNNGHLVRKTALEALQRTLLQWAIIQSSGQEPIRTQFRGQQPYGVFQIPCRKATVYPKFAQIPKYTARLGLHQICKFLSLFPI